MPGLPKDLSEEENRGSVVEATRVKVGSTMIFKTVQHVNDWIGSFAT